MNKNLKEKIISDLRARKIDGMLTAEIAKRYKISVQVAYRFMLNLWEEGFESSDGAVLARNSGTENPAIQHTHWFFT